MIQFEFDEDRAFFKKLLCHDDDALESFADLFDFRSPKVKRTEFGRIKAQVLRDKLALHGPVCQLRLAEDCNIASGLVLDHLIPLSTNKLNKALRWQGTERDASGGILKAPTQSFGSNNPRNLVLACVNCNSLKQNRILDREHMQRLICGVAW